MLRYRFLLVDTERSYQRPQQIFSDTIEQAEGWIIGVLKKAGDHAYVQIYETVEKEYSKWKKSDLEAMDDEGAVPDVQPVAEETKQP